LVDGILGSCKKGFLQADFNKFCLTSCLNAYFLNVKWFSADECVYGQETA